MGVVQGQADPGHEDLPQHPGDVLCAYLLILVEGQQKVLELLAAPVAEGVVEESPHGDHLGDHEACQYGGVDDAQSVEEDADKHEPWPSGWT